MNDRYDVVVVGARCAGASTAMLLARAGLSVLAVDRDAEGSDTLSTHALMRGAVLLLHRWGLLDRIVAAGTPAIRTTTFHYGEEAIAIPIKPKDGIDALYAPRRTVLDRILVEGAREAGAEVLLGVAVADLLRGADGAVRGVLLDRGNGAADTVLAGRVVGADGLRSRVARRAAAPVERAALRSASVVFGYFEGMEADGVHWHYAPGVSVGVIPTNDGLTCVFAAFPPTRFVDALGGGIEDLFLDVLHATSPSLARAVEGAKRVEKLRPFPGMPGFLKRPWGPGWALVGDAGFFRDPITAHGITDALRDAESLARALAHGTDRALAEYQAARDAIAVGMMDISERIASFEWDLEEAKALHRELSRQMNAEVEQIKGTGTFSALVSCD
jgi:flavin-dependent dehydrogenase